MMSNWAQYYSSTGDNQSQTSTHSGGVGIRIGGNEAATTLSYQPSSSVSSLSYDDINYGFVAASAFPSTSQQPSFNDTTSITAAKSSVSTSSSGGIMGPIGNIGASVPSSSGWIDNIWEPDFLVMHSSDHGDDDTASVSCHLAELGVSSVSPAAAVKPIAPATSVTPTSSTIITLPQKQQQSTTTVAVVVGRVQAQEASSAVPDPSQTPVPTSSLPVPLLSSVPTPTSALPTLLSSSSSGGGNESDVPRPSPEERQKLIEEIQKGLDNGSIQLHQLPESLASVVAPPSLKREQSLLNTTAENTDIFPALSVTIPSSSPPLPSSSPLVVNGLFIPADTFPLPSPSSSNKLDAFGIMNSGNESSVTLSSSESFDFGPVPLAPSSSNIFSEVASMNQSSEELYPEPSPSSLPSLQSLIENVSNISGSSSSNSQIPTQSQPIISQLLQQQQPSQSLPAVHYTAPISQWNCNPFHHHQTAVAPLPAQMLFPVRSEGQVYRDMTPPNHFFNHATTTSLSVPMNGSFGMMRPVPQPTMIVNHPPPPPSSAVPATPSSATSTLTKSAPAAVRRAVKNGKTREKKVVTPSVVVKSENHFTLSKDGKGELGDALWAEPVRDGQAVRQPREQVTPFGVVRLVMIEACESMDPKYWFVWNGIQATWAVHASDIADLYLWYNCKTTSAAATRPTKKSVEKEGKSTGKRSGKQGPKNQVSKELKTFHTPSRKILTHTARFTTAAQQYNAKFKPLIKDANGKVIDDDAISIADDEIDEVAPPTKRNRTSATTQPVRRTRDKKGGQQANCLTAEGLEFYITEPKVRSPKQAKRGSDHPVTVYIRTHLLPLVKSGGPQLAEEPICAELVVYGGASVVPSPPASSSSASSSSMSTRTATKAAAAAATVASPPSSSRRTRQQAKKAIAATTASSSSSSMLPMSSPSLVRANYSGGSTNSYSSSSSSGSDDNNSYSMASTHAISPPPPHHPLAHLHHHSHQNVVPTIPFSFPSPPLPSVSHNMMPFPSSSPPMMMTPGIHQFLLAAMYGNHSGRP